MKTTDFVPYHGAKEFGAGLEKITGTKPRKAQTDKIRSGFLRLSKDLDAVFA